MNKFPKSEFADGEGGYDCTGQIGPLVKLPEPEWPMYSFDAPASLVWGTIAETLHRRGWSDAKIKQWLQSKQARWAMDNGPLVEALTAAAKMYAAGIKQSDL